MPWVVPGYYQEPYGGGGRNRGGGREGGSVYGGGSHGVTLWSESESESVSELVGGRETFERLIGHETQANSWTNVLRRVGENESALSSPKVYRRKSSLHNLQYFNFLYFMRFW